MRQSGHYLFHHGGNEAYGQVRILRILSEADGISQKELQQKLAIKPGSASEILNKLEEKGLIERSRSEEDARRVNLHLTEKGKKEAEISGSDDPASLFQVLTEEEQEQLRQLLTKLLTSWQNAESRN